MRRAITVTLLPVILLFGAGCGGDEIFPEDEFVSKMVESGLEKPVAECVYAAIEKDKAIMADVVRAGGPNDDITNKSANKLKRIVARCILGANTSP